MENVTVPGCGHKPNRVLICGEAPGKEEAARGEPFVGRAGREQEWYLARHGLSAKRWYRTNVVKRYVAGNPDPTRVEINEATPVLEEEIRECEPRLVVAVGRFAARWFLGEEIEMEVVHGIPHQAGAFDYKKEMRAGGAVVVPVYHPALGFYDGDARALIAWDYAQIPAILEVIKDGGDVAFRYDEYEGNEVYEDVTGREMAPVLTAHDYREPLAVDTEGTVEEPWSIQVSNEPAFGYVLRRRHGRQYRRGVEELQRKIDAGTPIVMHNAMYDLPMLEAMGIETRGINVRDTMYMAYLTRLEPQGLKALAWRWCGMRMRDYRDVVGSAGRGKQSQYFERVLDGDWPDPEPRAVIENDGTSRLYRPQPIERRVEKILTDYYSSKTPDLIAAGEGGVDLVARWKAIDEDVRRPIEAELGPMPHGTLEDIELEDAVRYSARDADATLRLYGKLSEVVE